MHNNIGTKQRKQKLLDLTNPNIFIFNIASQIIRAELNGCMNIYLLIPSTKDLSMIDRYPWNHNHNQNLTPITVREPLTLSGFVLSAWDISMIISQNALILIHRSRRKCSLGKMNNNNTFILVIQ